MLFTYAITASCQSRQMHRAEAHRAWKAGWSTCFLRVYDCPRLLRYYRNGTASATNVLMPSTPSSNLLAPNPSRPTSTPSPPTLRPSEARTTPTTNKMWDTTRTTTPRRSALPRSQDQVRQILSATVLLPSGSRRRRVERRIGVDGRLYGIS